MTTRKSYTANAERLNTFGRVIGPETIYITRFEDTIFIDVSYGKRSSSFKFSVEEWRKMNELVEQPVAETD